MPSAACAERRDRNGETVADIAAELAIWRIDDEPRALKSSQQG
jgi:hypothetical protein